MQLIYNINMGKIESKNDFYKILNYIFLIILFTLSVSLPFLTNNDKDLYIYHLFNPTDIPFDGKIYAFYSYPIIVGTFIVLILSCFDKFDKSLKLKIHLNIFKIVIFFTFLFSTINYFRVIYPNSFIIGFNTSNLYPGLYFFVLFLLFLLLRIILDIIYINKNLASYRGILDLHESKIKIKRRLIIVNRVFVGLIVFSFFSLFFVPFYINFTEYMKELGFEHLLDLRTSVDYYFLSLFDSSFSLTIPSIILIYLVSILPLLLLVKDESKSIYKLIATMIFYILLTVFCLIFGLVNRGLIKPILELKVNGVAIFFIVLSLVSAFIVLISSIVILHMNRKEEKENVELDSL